MVEVTVKHTHTHTCTHTYTYRYTHAHTSLLNCICANINTQIQIYVSISFIPNICDLDASKKLLNKNHKHFINLADEMFDSMKQLHFN